MAASSSAPCHVSCQACDPDLAVRAVPRLRAAVASLDLSPWLTEVILCVDDLPSRDEGWLRLDPATVAGKGPTLTIYCSREALRREPAGSVENSGHQVWEQRPAPRIDAPWSPVDFDAASADAFFHHQCALAGDLLRGDLVPDQVAAGLAEAFAAAWDVVIDGRLDRDGLPGLDLRTRRARFSQLYSPTSVLLPVHWQIFQSLWEGGLATQSEVLGAVRRLPHL